MVWSCSCLLCRILVYPVIRRLTPVSTTQEAGIAEVSESISEAVNEVEVASTPATQPQLPPQPQLPQQPVGQPPEAQQGTQAQPTVVEVKIPQELVDRLNQLESELGELRKDITALNEGIKSVVLEFKEAIAELSSPFNMLRDQSKGGNGNGNGKRIKGFNVGEHQSRITPTSFFEVLKVIYSTLGRWSKDQVLTLIDGYVKAGLIDSETGKVLNGVVDLADNMRRLGISVEDQVAYLYAIINALNIKDQSFSDYVLRELLRRGRVD